MRFETTTPGKGSGVWAGPILDGAMSSTSILHPQMVVESRGGAGLWLSEKPQRSEV